MESVLHAIVGVSIMALAMAAFQLTARGWSIAFKLAILAAVLIIVKVNY